MNAPAAQPGLSANVKKALIAAFILLAVVLIHSSFNHKERLYKQANVDEILERPSAEAGRNILYATGDSVDPIIDQKQGFKPPLYPLALFGITQIAGTDAIPVFQEIIYFCLLAVFALIAFRCLSLPYAFAALLFAVSMEAFHVRFAIIQAEGMFTLAALAHMWFSIRYAEKQSTANLVGIGVCLAVICLTRYIGVLWLVPLTGLQMLLVHRQDLKAFFTRSTVAMLIGLPLISLYILNQYLKTGYLTGIDRFYTRFPHQEHWYTSLWANLLDTAGTFISDISLLYIDRYAALPPVGAAREALFWILALPVAVLVLGGLWLALTRLLPDAGKALLNGNAKPADVTFLYSALYFFSYLLTLLFIWTVGNNDPINSRFLLPAYPFLILLITGSIERSVKKPLTRLIVGGVFVLAILMQLYLLTK